MRWLFASLEFESVPQCGGTGGEHRACRPDGSCSAVQCHGAAKFAIKEAHYLFCLFSVLKYLSKGLQCGSEIVLSSIGLIQVFRITCDITCREYLLKYKIPNHKYNTSVWAHLSRQGSLWPERHESRPPDSGRTKAPECSDERNLGERFAHCICWTCYFYVGSLWLRCCCWSIIHEEKEHFYSPERSLTNTRRLKSN